ncbi:MAG TPA: 3-keto-5-aminohexanoate cleavage protein [Bacillota bacterium]|nr:3-keto-5-aminohexanoate cleavage protein [Bacillota bacterium]
MDKLWITAALVGAEVTREQQPHLPITPEEIAEEAAAAREAGAAIVHLHVRDAAGRPTQDRAVFARTIELIRGRTDVIIQASTGGAVGMTADERAQPLLLRPEMATLTCGSVNFGDGVFLNPPAVIEHFARVMKELGIKPEIEVFEMGMIASALGLVKRGLLETPLHFDLVMGVPGGIPASPAHLIHLVAELPSGSTWSVAGMGRHELTLGTMAIAMGGHVRVGFEDNIYYRKGELAAGNAQLVARIARIGRELERPPATPDEVRIALGIAR